MNIDLKSPAVHKTALSILLCGGMIGVFFFTHLLPFGYLNQSEKAATLKAEFEKKSTELQRARATVADLPRFEAEYAHLHERWEMAAELLPADREVAALLRHITLAAEQTGVSFSAFRPNAPKTEEHYVELPMQLEVYGDYHQIGSFLAELANMRRILTVRDLSLKQNTGGDSWASTTAEFTTSAYSLNNSPGGAAPAPNAAPVQPAASTPAQPAEGGESHDGHSS